MRGSHRKITRSDELSNQARNRRKRKNSKLGFTRAPSARTDAFEARNRAPCAAAASAGTRPVPPRGPPWRRGIQAGEAIAVRSADENTDNGEAVEMGQIRVWNSQEARACRGGDEQLDHQPSLNLVFVLLSPSFSFFLFWFFFLRRYY